MTAVRRAWIVALASGLLPVAVQAQAPPFSQTLRWGTGYLDVPVAAVLPGGSFRAAFSGFRVSPDVLPGDESRFHGDGVLSLGLFDRLELGTSLQSFNDAGDGGNLVGFFGRALIVDPTATGFGLAAGVRRLGQPDVPGAPVATPRLGFPAPGLLRRDPSTGGEVDADWSLYGVASLFLPGIQAPGLPDNTVSLSLGWGTGLFREGEDVEVYADGSWGGWFGGVSLDLRLGEATTLSLMADHGGLDTNLGGEVAWNGVRAGVHLLGLNHGESVSPWRSRKVGFSVSLTACPLLRRDCRPGVRRAHLPDTVRLPAPPPDTVIVRDTAGLAPGLARRAAGPGQGEGTGEAAPSGSVHDPLDEAVQGVQDGNGRAPGQVVLGFARLGPQEAIFLPLGPGVDGGDHHPGVEGPHGLHPPEFGVHLVLRHGADGVQRRLGSHAEVPFAGGDPRGLAQELPALPLHVHGHVPLPVGGRVHVEADEPETSAGNGGLGRHGAENGGGSKGRQAGSHRGMGPSRPTP